METDRQAPEALEGPDPADDVVVVVDLESIADDGARSFRDLVEGYVAEAWVTPRRIVLDLAPVKSMDPSAIAVLIRARARLVPWGGALVLRNVTPVVRSAIDAIGLGERLGIGDDQRDQDVTVD